MKKTRMPQRLLSLVLVLMMLISVLPVSAMAAELTPSDPETGLTATDVTNELTDSDRLAIFEENMDSGKVSRSEIPADPVPPWPLPRLPVWPLWWPSTSAPTS